MKLALLLLFLGISGTTKPPVPLEYKAAHYIHQENRMGGGHCTATAVGKHVLMTASHCEEPSTAILVDGREAQVDHIVRDGQDHSLFFLKGIEFEDIATVDLGNIGLPGDEILIVGNPSDFKYLVRRGTLAGYEMQPQGPLFFYDINGYFGDSGAAVYAKDHKIIGVVSLLRVREEDGISLKVLGGYPIMFKADELEAAKNF